MNRPMLSVRQRIVLAFLLIVFMIAPGIGLIVLRAAEDCHSVICHSLEPGEWPRWWWYNCEKPHCSDCTWGD